MMLHPALGELRAFASDDLSVSARASAAAHLSRCQRCRDDVQWIEATRASLQSAPTYTAPADVWSAIQRRVARNDIVLLPVGDQPASVARPARRAATAALFVLLLAASAAAVVKRAIIREWFNARATDPGAAPGVVKPAVLPRETTAIVEPPAVQLAIAPVNGAVLVSISAPDSALVLRVRLGDQPELELVALRGAGTGQFRSAPGRLMVQSPGAGEMVLTLPRSASRITLLIDGRIVLVKERSELRVLVRADTSGTEFILPVR